jgi:nucleotide-binding universal stress UspA family protein
MSPKKILVSLGPSANDLKSVHYAMSLAERLYAHVYILQQAAASGLDNPLSMWMGEALLDLINSARQAGLVVSHHIIHRSLEEEIVDLVRDEGIDVLVFGDDDAAEERLVLQIKHLIPSQIIQVKGKDHISYLKEEDGTR